MRKYKVYLHENRINGKRYVGITSIKPENRWRNGEGYKGCRAFYGAIQKYGWENFRHEILFVDLTAKEASEKERELIRKWNTLVPNGYNLESGGVDEGIKQHNSTKSIHPKRKGHKWTEEQREHMREINSGTSNPCYGKKASAETRKKMSDAHRGVAHSAEWRKHQSEALSGRKVSLETRQKCMGAKHHSSRPVKQLTLDGRHIATFGAVAEAARLTGLGSTSIGKCCRGKMATYGGFLWRYADANNSNERID